MKGEPSLEKNRTFLRGLSKTDDAERESTILRTTQDKQLNTYREEKRGVADEVSSLHYDSAERR